MIPATCQNCATPSPSPVSSLDKDGSPSLGVILGVLGGLALTAVVVFVTVPLIRRRHTRRGGRREDTESRTSTEPSGRSPRLSSMAGWRIGSRKSPSFRHHQETKTGPDALLLPLLPEVSTFTWSDLRRSQNASASAESVGGAEDMDTADVYSFPTNNATTSHFSLLQYGPQDGATLHAPSVFGGPGGSAYTGASADVSPSANRSVQPTPRSKEPSTQDVYADEPLAAGSTAAHAHAIPIARVSLPPSASASRTTFYTPGIEMEPVLERGAVKAKAGSRRGSLQLPSPPASPPVPPYSSSSHSRPQSYAQPHSRSQSQASVQQVDWRFSAQRTRPPLPNTRSAPPTALPFRPTSTSSTAPSQSPSWSHPVATNLPLPAASPRSPPAPSSSPVNLTAAFRTSILRSGSQSTGGTTDIGRYPSITTSSPPPIPEAETWSPASARLRSGSVASERPARAPHGARPKPVESLRNESSRSEVRSSRRATMSAAPLPVSTSPLGGDGSPSPGDHASRRAYLRSSMSLTPRVEESNTPRGQTAALSYFDPRNSRTATPHEERTTSGDPASRSASRAPGSDTMRATDDLRERFAAYSLSPSRRSSISQSPSNPHPPSHTHPLPTSTPTSRSQQPVLVPKKDSLALKPIPVSALMHSPPHSPPRSTRSREGSLSVPSITHGSRSRAGSIASVAPSREGSIYEGRLGRQSSRRAGMLPPLEPLPPMEFAKFGDDDSDDDTRS